MFLCTGFANGYQARHCALGGWLRTGFLRGSHGFATPGFSSLVIVGSHIDFKRGIVRWVSGFARDFFGVRTDSQPLVSVRTYLQLFSSGFAEFCLGFAHSRNCFLRGSHILETVFFGVRKRVPLTR